MIFAVIVAVAVIIQLLVGIFMKRRFFHWAFPILLVLTAVVLFISAMLVQGWDALGLIFLAIGVGIAAVACLLTLIIMEIVRTVRKKK